MRIAEIKLRVSPSRHTGRRSLLASALLLAGFAMPAQAAPLLQDLSNHSLQCAADSPYFIAPDGKSIATLHYELAPPGTAWRDLVVALVPPALKENGTDRIEVVMPAVPGVVKEEVLAFVRTWQPAKPGAANRKRAAVVTLYANGSTVGDECAVEKGRPAYLDNRFNLIREGVCGNDPAPACEDLLAKTCGAEPTLACVTKVGPDLEKVSKAYFDKLNARAAKPAPQGK